jgi:hypothetical protein
MRWHPTPQANSKKAMVGPSITSEDIAGGISLMAQTISAQKAYVGNDTKNFLMCGSG